MPTSTMVSHHPNTPLPPPEEDNWSTTSSDSLGSISDLEPQTIDLTDGKFDAINANLFNIVHYNVNSLLNKVEQVEAQARELGADIICLTETKIDDTTAESNYSIPGYNTEYRHRTSSGGGVLVYIKDSLPYVRMPKLESPKLEHVSIDVIVNKKRYCVNTVYRPPNNLAAEQQEFLSEMEMVLSKIRKHRCANSILVGDFNYGSCYSAIPGLTPKPLDDKAPELFTQFGYTQLVDLPTRQVNLSCSLLDLIYVEKMDSVVLTALVPPMSDHSGTLLSLNSLTFKPQPKIFRSYNYEEANWNLIREKLLELENMDIYTGDINSLALTFTNKLVEIRDTCVPNKEFKIFEKDRPWFTSLVKNKLRKSNRLYKAYKKLNETFSKTHPHDPNKAKLGETVTNAHDNYKSAKKDYVKCARQAKTQYLRNLKKTLLNPGVSSKKKFKILSRTMNTGKNAHIPPLIDNGRVIHKPNEKANILSEYFSAKATLNNPEAPAPQPEGPTPGTSLDGLLTSHYEVGPIIRSLKTADHSPCGIPSRFLQLCLERLGPRITKPVTKLLNAIFQSGEYPDCFKIAIIKPIWKGKGPKTDKSNFRPISILPTISKCTEAILHKRIIGHLADNNLISKNQAAYLQGDSTTLQLSYITHKIRQAWAEGKLAHGCFLDVSSAFDCIWHHGLLAKIKHAGFSGDLLNLLTSYLSNRVAKTCVEGHYSETAKITSGVPQGSRLGPVLFILYVNDIATQLNLDSIPLIYADDTTLLAFGDDTNQTVTQLNNDLSKIAKWAKTWKLKFNGSKSKDIIFTPNKTCLNNSLPIYLNGDLLDRVSAHKHLGLIIESDLTWNMHVAKVVQSANLKMSILLRVKDLSRPTLDTLFKLHVRSILDYALPVYGPSLDQRQLSKLEKIQYLAARIVTSTPKCSSAEKLYKELGWESICNRIKFLSISLFHKIHTNSTRPLTRDCLPPKNPLLHPTRTGRAYLEFPYHKLILKKTLDKSFFSITAKQWDLLPTDLKQTWDFPEFKLGLTNLLKPPKCRLYNLGSKFANSIHCQLRIGRSQLNQHLFTIGRSNTPGCLCGCPTESVEHFLLDCFLYRIEREELLNYLKTTRNVLCSSLDKYTRKDFVSVLLFGEHPNNSNRYPYNKLLFKAVQNFLVKTKRLHFKSVLQLI